MANKKPNKKGLFSQKTDRPKGKKSGGGQYAKKEGSVLEKRKPKNKKNKKGLYSLKTDKPVKKEGSVYKKTNQDGGSYTAKKPGAAAKQLEALGKKTGPVKKTEARVARDYAANAAYDAEHGYKKEAKFEKKKLMHVVNRIAGSKNR